MTPDEADTDLAPRRVAELLQEGAVELVDVREPYEHQAGRIAGARHVEMTRLTAEAANIPRERTVVFYCRVGSRSAVAAEAFRGAGWEAFNLQGGLVAWVEDGLPIEPEDGEVAPH